MSVIWKTRWAWVLLCLACLQGCATKIYEKFNIDQGTSLSIDAKQRVVLTSVRRDRDQVGSPYSTISCAEPSPDALSAISAAVSGSFSPSPDRLIQAAFGNSETAASIGLRTQTIQLLRDGMYRICEGYLGGAIGRQEFVALQRRYQNLMMGLLAIEQLTGAVKAKQAALSGSAAGGAGAGGADVTKEQEAVQRAKTDEVTAQSNLATAELALGQQRVKVESAEKTLKDANAAQARTPSTANEELVTLAKTKVAEERTTFDTQKLERDKTQALLTIAKENAAFAQQSLKLAQSRVSAQASGNAVLSGGGGNGYQGLDPESTKEIAGTVKAVVSEVILKSFLYDTCLATFKDGPPRPPFYEFPVRAPAEPEDVFKGRIVQYDSLSTSEREAYKAQLESYVTFTGNCSKLFSEATQRAIQPQ